MIGEVFIFMVLIQQNICDGPFALILDVYRALFEKSVIDPVAKLGIKQFFVPVCQIGIYLTLDRMLFGNS